MSTAAIVDNMILTVPSCSHNMISCHEMWLEILAWSYINYFGGWLIQAWIAKF